MGVRVPVMRETARAVFERYPPACAGNRQATILALWREATYRLALTWLTKLFRLSLGSGVMRTVNMHEAKTHLSRLVEAAAKGEPFIIARAGKPVVKVVALEAPGAGSTRRVGFMAGKISVPEDFDRMGSEEIGFLFEGVEGDG